MNPMIKSDEFNKMHCMSHDANVNAKSQHESSSYKTSKFKKAVDIEPKVGSIKAVVIEPKVMCALFRDLENF